ncbi:acetylneuraminic acid synthetase [Tistrella bauzanensis]|uniref:Acetylneuraminic acid synthetase n=1 Tax=Tistrella bauzanensis TaxID=657419 RepID=A0ABQ1INH8_9PROT|nr:N-acetylneuraminate synthase family protein [Tistrella bauzanensis]GGB48137.1 acetylneuraminic acid synthetase [Tistrella bauzanensis]
MIIETKIVPYLTFVEETIATALRKISENKHGIVFAVSEAGRLEGVLTDGDFRRWVVEQPAIDLERPVSEAMNRTFRSLPRDAAPERIAAELSERITALPLVDDQGRIIAVARVGAAVVRIGDREIGPDHPAYIIAEIGNNHQGDLSLARRLIDLAADAGADSAKFQMRQLDKLYRNAGNNNDAAEDLGSQYTLDLLAKFSLSNDDLFRAFDHVRARGMTPLCTPWDHESVELLNSYGLEGFKVASADMTNLDLLTALAATGKPLIVSTGMSTDAEIKQSSGLLHRLGAPFVLLHCNSTYPAPFKDVNLRYMKRLAEIGDCVVGYSGHERDINVSMAAIALGAKVVEKHFTVDKGLEGNDHKVSLLPDEFRRLVDGIRQVEEAMGEGGSRQLSQGELMNREILAKSLVAKQQIAIGTVITADMVDVKSPGKGIQPNRLADLVGRTMRREVPAGDFFYPSDLADGAIEPRPYAFKRPWGVPVRYHDFQRLLDKTNLSLVEFHLSYKDLDIELAKYLEGRYPIGYVVHAPELFANDHTMNLVSDDAEYRAHSVKEMQRVIDVTRRLRDYFDQPTDPLIVTNVGGFTTDRHLHPRECTALYERLSDSLKLLARDGVEIIPQTMPPFPWHFGGQSFHNLFVDAETINSFCAAENMRICLDISHSKLACNHYKWSFEGFCEAVAAVTAHMHIADSKGVDGEGLQVGDGDIDFRAFGHVLDRTQPGASFIPEIWQGHKNDGEGFWIALERLEKAFAA